MGGMTAVLTDIVVLMGEPQRILQQSIRFSRRWVKLRRLSKIYCAIWAVWLLGHVAWLFDSHKMRPAPGNQSRAKSLLSCGLSIRFGKQLLVNQSLHRHRHQWEKYGYIIIFSWRFERHLRRWAHGPCRLSAADAWPKSPRPTHVWTDSWCHDGFCYRIAPS